MQIWSMEQFFSYFDTSGDGKIDKNEVNNAKNSVFEGFVLEENMSYETFEQKNLENYKKYEEAASNSEIQGKINQLKQQKESIQETEKEELDKKLSFLEKAEDEGVVFEDWEIRSWSIDELEKEFKSRKEQIPLINETLELLKTANGDKYKIAELLNQKLDFNNRKTKYAYNTVCKEAFGEGYWGTGVGTGSRQGYIYYNIRNNDGSELHIGYALKDKKAFKEEHYGLGRSSYEK